MHNQKCSWLCVISLIAAVRGHYVMTSPAVLPGTTFNTATQPCGSGVATNAQITVLQPNSWVNVTWWIRQSHNRMTTISLSQEGDMQTQTMSCVLLDYIPVAANSGQHNMIISVWIPNIQCNDCYLQVKNSDWYSCARVKITGTIPRDTYTCMQPCSWPYYQSTQTVTTAEPRWMTVPNYPGRATKYLNIYGQGLMTTGSPNAATTCTNMTTVSVGGTTSTGELAIAAGASISVAAAQPLMNTNMLWIQSGTRYGNSVVLTIAGPDDRWFAVGFGAQMIGSDAVIWSSGKTTNNRDNLMVGDYKIGTTKTIDQVVSDTVQNWILLSTQVLNNSRHITIQRQVNTGDLQDTVLDQASTQIIWAMGDATGQYQLAAHGQQFRSAGSVLTWTTQTTAGGGGGGSGGANSQSSGFGVYGAPAGSSTPGTSAHGFFMFLSWGMLIPGAVLMNRYRHQFAFLQGKIREQDTWFQLHRAFNCGALFCMFIGIVIKWGELGMITNSFHSVIGMMLFFLAAISIAGGFLRPAQDAANRPMWYKIHKYAGITYLFVAFIIQIPIGLSVGGATVGAIVVYVFWLLFMAGIVVWLERRGGPNHAQNMEKTVDMNDTTKVEMSDPADTKTVEGETPAEGAAYSAVNAAPPRPPPPPGGQAIVPVQESAVAPAASAPPPPPPPAV